MYKEDKLKAAIDDRCGQAPAQAVSGLGAEQEMIGKTKAWEPPTKRGEHERAVGYHRQEAEKHDQAAAFFREHPDFDLFVRLLRSGIISIY